MGLWCRWYVQTAATYKSNASFGQGKRIASKLTQEVIVLTCRRQGMALVLAAVDARGPDPPQPAVWQQPACLAWHGRSAAPQPAPCQLPMVFWQESS